jgi:hypothetical protein
MKLASDSCLTLLRQWICRALRFALEITGSNKAASIAIIAITTNSSTKVNAFLAEQLEIVLIAHLLFFSVAAAMNDDEPGIADI